MKLKFLCVVLAVALDGAGAAPLPVTSCKALAFDAASSSLKVLSGSGSLLWSVQASLAREHPASLSRDGSKVAFVSSSAPPQIVVAAPGKRITAPITAPASMASLNALQWLPNDHLKSRWQGKAAASFVFQSLTGWSTTPQLTSDGPVSDGNDCTSPVEGGPPVCAEDFLLTSSASTVGQFDHSTAAAQPRSSFSQAVINVGSAVAVPGATGLQLKVLSIAGGHAELEVLDSENGGGRVSATGGTELLYPTPSGTYLFRTDAVQPGSVTQSFIAVGESLLTFRSVIALDSGVLGVLVGSHAESSFLELWQKVGTGYVKRSRTAMPRTDEVKKIEVSQPSVLAVHDASGFYEVPYSLSYSGTVLTGVSLGSVVTRPSTLAGQSVLEWNCD